MSHRRIAIALTDNNAPHFRIPTDAQEYLTTARYGNVTMLRSKTGSWLGCGESLVWVPLASQQAEGYLAKDFWGYSLVEKREFFLRLFLLLLRAQGLHLLHANALAVAQGDEKPGVLLVGDCGAGKTTLSLSLLRAGWHYVTDDVVLIAPTSVGYVNAHAVRRGFACTWQTAAQWPELASLAQSSLALNRAKVLLQPEQLYPDAYQPACQPRLLLFPHVTAEPQSRLTALDPTDFFLQLLAQPRAGILVDPATTPAVLALFQTLVQQTQGYILALGRDVYERPAAVASLLESVIPAPIRVQ